MYAGASWVGKVVGTAEHLEWSARASCERKGRGEDRKEVAHSSKDKDGNVTRGREREGEIDGDRDRGKPYR